MSRISRRLAAPTLPGAAPDVVAHDRDRNGPHVHCVRIEGGSVQRFPGSLFTSA